MDPFKRHRILEMLRVLTPAATFILSTFFRSERTFDTEAVKIDIKQNKRRLAPFVSPLAEGKFVERNGYLTRTFSPAYVKPKSVFQPSDLFKRQPGEMLESSSSNVDRLVAEELADLQDQVNRREEWMAAQALLNGSVAVVGEGVNETVDFLMPANHQVTLLGTDQWTDAGSDPIADITAWRRTIQQDSGRRADVIILAPDVMDVFIAHEKVKGQLDTRRVELGQFQPRELPEGVTYVGDLFSGAVSIYTYEEWYHDGTQDQPMMPTGKVIVGASGARSERLYGAIQDFDAGGLAEARWFPKTWTTKDPSLYYLMLQSAPLPSPVEVNAYLSATVL